MPSSKSDHNSKDKRVETGRSYEKLTARFYIDKGYQILEQNWRSGRKEIDLIVKKDKRLVFVEVKSSSSKKFGHPVERVDKKKVKNITEVAKQYLIVKEIKQVDLHFDVVTFLNGVLEYFPDAYSDFE